MNCHGIENETIISQNDETVELSFLIPENSDFFDGHFPEYKLLPAVAQFELVTRFAKKYFSTERCVMAIKRIKFSAPIRPNTNITLHMDFNRNKSLISYTISDTNVAERIYSTGTFSVKNR